MTISISPPASPPTPDVMPGDSSYFAHPERTLDPKLFSGTKMKPEIEAELKTILDDFWRPRYNSPERWSKLYLAGSSASYQWHDAPGLGDLDMLVGVNFPKFLDDNPLYRVMSEDEIAKQFNVEFFHELDPQLSGWHGYEVTFYVNPGAYDITRIRPYAAYDLTKDRWAVNPIPLPPDWNPRIFFPQSWWSTVNKEIEQTKRLISDYNMAQRSNNATALADLVPRLLATFEDIHTGRKKAFAAGGEGYQDFNNFRWQTAKMAGTEQALRAIHQYYAT